MQVNPHRYQYQRCRVGPPPGNDSDTQQTTLNAAFIGVRGAARAVRRRPGVAGAPVQGSGNRIAAASPGWSEAVSQSPRPTAGIGYSVVSDGELTGTNRRQDLLAARSTRWPTSSGHNMGSQHDRNTAKGSDGKLDDPTITARLPICSATSRRRSTPSWPTAIRARRPISRSSSAHHLLRRRRMRRQQFRGQREEPARCGCRCPGSVQPVDTGRR